MIFFWQHSWERPTQPESGLGHPNVIRACVKCSVFSNFFFLRQILMHVCTNNIYTDITNMLNKWCQLCVWLLKAKFHLPVGEETSFVFVVYCFLLFYSFIRSASKFTALLFFMLSTFYTEVSFSYRRTSIKQTNEDLYRLR